VNAVPALVFAFVMLLAWPIASATSPVGVWHLEQASLERTLDQLLEALLAQAPEGQKADMRAMLDDQREDLKAEMSRSIAATVEFGADGTVVFNEPDSADQHRGEWRLEGERLVVTDDDPESPDLLGKVQPDRIELTFGIDETNPDQGLLGELVWVLVPVR
jgi:hypothetical protein